MQRLDVEEKFDKEMSRERPCERLIGMLESLNYETHVFIRRRRRIYAGAGAGDSKTQAGLQELEMTRYSRSFVRWNVLNLTKGREP